MIDRLAELYRLLSVANALFEAAKLGEALSQIHARLHRRERGQAKALTREIADQVGDILTEEIGCRLIGPHDVLSSSKQHSRCDLEMSVITSRGECKSPLPSFEGLLEVAIPG